MTAERLFFCATVALLPPGLLLLLEPQLVQVLGYQAVWTTLLGCLCLGLNGGLLGSLMIVRRLSLLGDVLAHCVLPGVALAFYFAQSKHTAWVMVGAVCSCLLAMCLMQALQHSTRIRNDSILGLILSGFYALGVCVLSFIQNNHQVSKAGLHVFLLGQASALTLSDLTVLAGLTLVTLTGVLLFFRAWLVTAFDPAFSHVTGLPVKSFGFALNALLVCAVVTSIKATGAILLSAMLVIPAAAAMLVIRRFAWLFVAACIWGCSSAFTGVLLSCVRPQLPTGPCIVLCAAGIFGLVLVLEPQGGLLRQGWLQRQRRKQILLENTLKAVFHFFETQPKASDVLQPEALAPGMGLESQQVVACLQALVAQGYAVPTEPSGQRFMLTPAGWTKASAIVRGHRLWELYLTQKAYYPKDHVHDDAEAIEHVLDPLTLQALERQLAFPTADPHGKPIPPIAGARPLVRL
jgi:manganese/zinc/iron transport system permease protein